MIDYRKYIAFMFVAVSVALVFGSCYPKRVGPAGPGGKRLTWDEMNLDQRKDLMRNDIVPKAGKIFAEWRPERFSSVACTLCHGEGAKAGIFKMPADHLPRLSGEVLLGPEFEKHPDTTRLKLDRLVPVMAESLGLKPFSIITRTGFGCYSCHLGPNGPMFGN